MAVGVTLGISQKKYDRLRVVWECLCSALDDESDDRVRTLVRDCGADKQAVLTWPDGWGRTLLHDAIDTARVGRVRILLEVGADANYKHNYRTPLQMAAQAGSVPILELLLAHKAKLNARDEMLNFTALMVAALNKHEGAALFLLERGARCDSGVVDASGRTTASIALSNDLAPVVLALVAEGVIDGDPLKSAVLVDAKRTASALFGLMQDRVISRDEKKQLLWMCRDDQMRRIIRAGCAGQLIAGALQGEAPQGPVGVGRARDSLNIL